MPTPIPQPLRAAAGLAAAAVDSARRLPRQLVGLPVLAVSTALQASLKAQQRYAELVARGDQLIGALRGQGEDAPPWARFDDEAVAESARVRSAFDAEPDPAEELLEEEAVVVLGGGEPVLDTLAAAEAGLPAADGPREPGSVSEPGVDVAAADGVADLGADAEAVGEALAADAEAMAEAVGEALAAEALGEAPGAGRPGAGRPGAGAPGAGDAGHDATGPDADGLNAAVGALPGGPDPAALDAVVRDLSTGGDEGPRDPGPVTEPGVDVAADGVADLGADAEAVGEALAADAEALDPALAAEDAQALDETLTAEAVGEALDAELAAGAVTEALAADAEALEEPAARPDVVTAGDALADAEALDETLAGADPTANDGYLVAEPPVPRYDELSIPQLRGRLRSLSETQVQQLVAYERTHQARPPYLTMLENRLTTLRSR
jgi:hypothetical protein